MDKTDKKRLNRRRALRIYEQVDLFYHKIEFDHEMGEKLSFNNVLDNAVQSLITSDPSSPASSSFEQLLPGSYSLENETLNVNISTTGISFTCKEKLVRGDYLVIRVLLLSRMTVIMTCCRIVHIKPSNPFEKNQYPYLVGARFVKLKLEDKELLNRHINKKRNQGLIVMGLAVCIVLIVIQVPDLAFELLLGLCSFLFDTIIDLTHLLYECIEYSLDQVVEHVFHTNLHNTQTIVFYIQVVLAVAIAYPLFRSISSICKDLYNRSRLLYSRKKSSLLYCWREQALLNKFGIICTGITVITFFSLFLI